MSKCSKCQNDFIPLLKSDGLPYKTCDRCKCTDKKYRDKHKEQIKVYRDQYYLDNQDKIKEYREVNKTFSAVAMVWTCSLAIFRSLLCLILLGGGCPYFMYASLASSD
jgi:hypothetical protein